MLFSVTSLSGLYAGPALLIRHFRTAEELVRNTSAAIDVDHRAAVLGVDIGRLSWPEQIGRIGELRSEVVLRGAAVIGVVLVFGGCEDVFGPAPAFVGL